MGKRYKYSAIYVLVAPDKSAYVGQTTDLTNRRSRYKTLTCHNQVKVMDSLRRYGFDSHRIDILKHFEYKPNRTELDFWEKFYYSIFESAGYSMMNLKAPGWNGKHSDCSIEKSRVSHAGQKPWNTGTKGVCIAWNKGLKKSDYANR